MKKRREAMTPEPPTGKVEPAQAAPKPAPSAPEAVRDDFRKSMEGMTPEQRREAVKRRLEAMTPEQREAWKKRREAEREGAGKDRPVPQ